VTVSILGVLRHGGDAEDRANDRAGDCNADETEDGATLYETGFRLVQLFQEECRRAGFQGAAKSDQQRGLQGQAGT
jgi:hypothetical protein